MKTPILTLLAFFMLSFSINAQSIFDQNTIKEFMDRTNNYQLKNPWRAYDDNWIRGTYYAGVMACYRATGDEKYLEQSDKLCSSLKWKIPTLPQVHQVSGANLLTIGQTMIESYMAKPEKK